MPDPTAVATRIVIAEDEAIIRMDLREILEEDGYEVVGECGNGEDAIALVIELAPDVAILDVKMPVMDGIEAAKVLTDERRCAVVLLTAFSQRELIEAARDAGVMAYVVKPFERSDLIPAIEVAIGRFSELSGLAGRASELEERLEVRKLVDRAKGRLIDGHGMSEQDAFAFLQRTAMNQRRTIKEVCGDVIDGSLVP
ncbi:MAG TPA: response regulator [Microthrixaceae bacterium]|nr:response regulator [Microthrixaceae bacterium]